MCAVLPLGPSPGIDGARARAEAARAAPLVGSLSGISVRGKWLSRPARNPCPAAARSPLPALGSRAACPDLASAWAGGIVPAKRQGRGGLCREPQVLHALPGRGLEARARVHALEPAGEVGMGLRQRSPFRLAAEEVDLRGDQRVGQ